jgi:hypothetical protein
MKRDPGVLQWTRESLERLIAARIAAHTKSNEEDVITLWNSVFPEITRGAPTREFVIRRTLLRPRDVIQFCQKAVENAQRAGRVEVSEDDLYGAWEPTGELIISQIEIEYQHVFPGLGDLVYAFLDAPWTMSWADARERLLARLAQVEHQDWYEKALEDPKMLLEALYETGVAGVETRGGSRWFRSDRPLQEFASVLSEEFTVVIHPAFHRFLRSLAS